MMFSLGNRYALDTLLLVKKVRGKGRRWAITRLVSSNPRKRQGLVVTQTMLQDLLAVFAWHAKGGGAALEGKVVKVSPRC